MTNFRLADPTLPAEAGGCGDEPRCGHLYVHIDGDDGDQPGRPYNNIGFYPQVEALFTYIDPTVGEHVITLDLMGADHQPVLVDGAPVSASRVVITERAVPSIQILSPPNRSTQTPINDDDLTLAVTFSAPNITLAETSAECGDQYFCGQVAGYLDGDLVALGISGARPIPIPMARAEEPAGEHIITLKVVDFSGAAMTFDDPADDEGPRTLEDAITLNVTLPQPALILDLRTGQRVRLGGDSYKTAVIGFALVDVAAGTSQGCAEVAIPCGQVRSHLDGDAGNAAVFPYNSYTTSEPTIHTYFVYLGAGEAPFGEHRVKLSMWDYRDKPMVDDQGAPIEDETTVFAISQTDPNLRISTPTDGSVLILDPAPGAAPQLPITFAASQFEIAAEQDCAGGLPCGFVRVYLDDEIVGDTVTSPYAIDMSGQPGGSHRVRLALHAHGGEALMWPYDGGVPVEDAVGITTYEAGPPE